MQPLNARPHRLAVRFDSEQEPLPIARCSLIEMHRLISQSTKRDGESCFLILQLLPQLQGRLRMTITHGVMHFRDNAMDTPQHDHNMIPMMLASDVPVRR
jgi:hypothetical protein